MRIRTLGSALFLLLLAAVPLSYWLSARYSAAERLERWQMRETIERTDDRLEQPIDTPQQAVSLGEFAKLIERQTGLRVEFDDQLPAWAGGSHPGPPQKWQVDLPGGRLPLVSVLENALGQVELTYDVLDGGVQFTSEDLSDDLANHYVENYPLPQSGAAQFADADQWAALIPQTVWPVDYTVSHIETAPGTLVVLQSPRIHRQLRRLFRAIDRLGSSPPSTDPVSLWPAVEPGFDARVFAALDEPCSAEWNDTPLDEALRELIRPFQIPLVIDQQQLAEVGVHPDTPVSGRFENLSLRSILDIALSELELTHIVQNGSLVITQVDGNQGDLGMKLVAYPVHDLGTGKYQKQYDLLAELLETHLRSETWHNDYGVAGNIVIGPEGWLIAHQPPRAHRKIESLLVKLWQMRSGAFDELAMPIEEPSARERAIAEALDREIVLNQGEMPLEDAARILSQLIEMPIVLKSRHLLEAGISLDTRLNLDLPRRKARYQLTSLIEPLELTWVVDDEVVQITTSDNALLSARSTWLYDTRLLTDADLGAFTSTQIGHSLEQLLTASAPGFVHFEGGGYTNYGGILVVSTPQVVHEHIEQMLHGLARTANDERGLELLPQVLAPCQTDEDQAIEQKLRTLVDVDFQNAPLEVAIEQLASKHELPLILDKRRLFEQVAAEDQSVTLAAQQMTLGGVLDRITEPRGLWYGVNDGSLVVGRRVSPRNMTPRLYRIGDLNREKWKNATASTKVLDIMSDNQPSRWTTDDHRMYVLGDEWLVAHTSSWVHTRLQDYFHELRTGETTQTLAERRLLEKELEPPVRPRAEGVPTPAVLEPGDSIPQVSVP